MFTKKYQMDGTDNSCICLCISSFRQIYHSFCFEILKKKFQTDCNTRRYWKQSLSKYLNNYLLTQCKLTCSVRQINISLYRNCRILSKPTSIVFCLPLYMGHVNVIERLITAAFAVFNHVDDFFKTMDFHPTDFWGFKTTRPPGKTRLLYCVILESKDIKV